MLSKPLQVAGVWYLCEIAKGYKMLDVTCLYSNIHKLSYIPDVRSSKTWYVCIYIYIYDVYIYMIYIYDVYIYMIYMYIYIYDIYIWYIYIYMIYKYIYMPYIYIYMYMPYIYMIFVYYIYVISGCLGIIGISVASGWMFTKTQWTPLDLSRSLVLQDPGHQVQPANLMVENRMLTTKDLP